MGHFLFCANKSRDIYLAFLCFQYTTSEPINPLMSNRIGKNIKIFMTIFSWRLIKGI